MDHPRDSVWIEPLEASTLSVDEETDTQTPVSVEGSMNWFIPGVDGSEAGFFLACYPSRAAPVLRCVLVGEPFAPRTSC